MPESDLSQIEADLLISLPKHRVDSQAWSYSSPGNSVSIPLVSEDGREEFRLDLWHARINLSKSRQQTRARQVTPLVRLDIGGAPHRNPDGAEVESPHIHHYREGYDDKWAEPIPAGAFRDLKNPVLTVEDFMRYCNVVEPPAIQANWIA